MRELTQLSLWEVTMLTIVVIIVVIVLLTGGGVAVGGPDGDPASAARQRLSSISSRAREGSCRLTPTRAAMPASA